MNTVKHAAEASVLLIVQPYLTAYRLPVFVEIARHFGKVTLASSPAPVQSGYGVPAIGGTPLTRQVLLPMRSWLGGRLLFQQGLISLIWRLRPDKLLITANPRMVSFWMALLLCRGLGIDCYAHGQGLFNKPQPGLVRVLAYRLLIALSTRYVCYTESGLEGVRKAGITKKLAVAQNSLCIAATVAPAEKTLQELGVLFLGRLREGSALDLLINAIAVVRERTGLDISLQVVGGGVQAAALRTAHRQDWIVWHGEIYDAERIRDISRSCRVGCYPGAAGLSLLHYMALSLVPIVHDRLDLHMGPEASYVQDGVNGLLFSHSEVATRLPQVLTRIFNGGLSPMLASAAHETYCQLNEPSLGERLARILQAP